MMPSISHVDRRIVVIPLPNWVTSWYRILEINFFLGRIVSTHSRRRRLSDAYEASRRLSDAYETSRFLSDAYRHFFKKKNIFVIFGRFKKRNPRAVGFFRWILDRNVVVHNSK